MTPRKGQLDEEEKVRLLERVILSANKMDSSNSIQKKRIVRRQTWFAAGGRPLMVRAIYCLIPSSKRICWTKRLIVSLPSPHQAVLPPSETSR